MVENHRYPLSFIDAWLRIMNIPFLSIINAQMHGSELWNPIFFFVHKCIDAWLRLLDNLSFTDAFPFWCEQVSYLFATAAGTQERYTGLIGGRLYSPRK